MVTLYNIIIIVRKLIALGTKIIIYIYIFSIDGKLLLILLEELNPLSNWHYNIIN